MKLELSIILGFISWLVILIISMFINPLLLDNKPFFPIVPIIMIVIVTTLLGIYYIRQFDENETKEGFKLGIIFIIVDIICDLVIIAFTNNSLIIHRDYKVHLIYMVILTPIITTMLGYLAEMEIKLEG